MARKPSGISPVSDGSKAENSASGRQEALLRADGGPHEPEIDIAGLAPE